VRKLTDEEHEQRRVARAVETAFTGGDERHRLAEKRRYYICTYFHGREDLNRTIPKRGWITDTYKCLGRNLSISSSTVRSIHRRYCRRDRGGRGPGAVGSK
jgi:hypothetical protein